MCKPSWILASLSLVAFLYSCQNSAPTGPAEEVNVGVLPRCTISPDSGVFSSLNALKISISCPTEGASIHYTIDGTTPTRRSAVFSDSIRLGGYRSFLVVKARSWYGTDSSPWVQAILMDSLHSPIYIGRGSLLFSESVLVNIANISDMDWSYLYTTDGSEPSSKPDVSTKANTGSILITGKTTLKVKAVLDGIAYPIVFEQTFTPVVPYSGPYGTLSDDRDGQSYRTVEIGTQTWMAENLRFLPSQPSTGATCYGDTPANCSTDGALYSWAEAMAVDPTFNSKTWGGNDRNRRGICPSGWHVPRDSEWVVLLNFVESKAQAGAGNANLALLSDSGWLNDRKWSRDPIFGIIMQCSDNPGTWTYNGVDLYGFAVQPMGLRRADGTYDFRSYYAGFWSSTEAPDFIGYSWARNICGGFQGVWRDAGNSRVEGHSLRCVMD